MNSSSIAIVTDSVACVPQELAVRYGIRVCPVSLIFGGKVYQDGIDLSPDDFYKLLRESPELPTTSSPSPGSYLDIFRELSQSYGHIICITVSSNLTSIFDSARSAREIMRELMPQADIHIVDSGTACMAQGFVVLEAARAVARGESLAQTLEAVTRVMGRVQLIAMLDTLYYLAKGGRIPKVAAWAGSLLRIKPIIRLFRGQIGMIDRSRTGKQAVEKMLRLMRGTVQGKRLHCAVIHSDAQKDAEELRERVASEFSCVELYVSPFTPVIGTHAGPGALGVVFYCED